MEMFADYTVHSAGLLAEEVGLEIARENSVFRAVEEEFVGALVGTRMRQHSTCQQNCSKKMVKCPLKFHIIQQMEIYGYTWKRKTRRVRFEYRGYRVYYFYFYGDEGHGVSPESTLSGSNFESISESE